MSDSDAGGPDWDDTADVICVGGGPGVLAYGLCCLAADLDVLFLEYPSTPDGVVADFMAAMTEDLADAATLNPGREIAVSDHPREHVARKSLEPFVGENLRQWSALCLASPVGVMFTEVPDVLVPMTDSGGHSITAAVLGPYRTELENRLSERTGQRDGRLTTIIFDEGRIAGAELDDGSTVAAVRGLAFAVGPATPEWPPAPDDDLDVAVVGRPAGRFARIELFRR